MKRTEIYGSGAFLKATREGTLALPNEPYEIVGTIKELRTHTFDDDKQQRVIRFVEGKFDGDRFIGGLPDLGLNVTNWKAIEHFTGKDDDDDWVGTKIEMFVVPEPKSPSGHAVRVRKPRGQPAQAPTPQEPPPKICLGEVGAKRLAATLSGKSLDIAALRAYLHTKAIPHRGRIDQPPEQWPSDWGQEIKAWLENPTTVEQPYVPINESDLPF